MPHKFNRNRNTFSVSRDDYFSKQRFDSQFQTPTQSLNSFSNPEKTFICLKLLEKCSQKMFKFNEEFYEGLIKDQSDCNNILSSTSIDTRRESVGNKKEGNYLSKFDVSQQSDQRRVKKSSDEDRLISSWTAFENLDITYKIKQRELTEQNILLRKNIQQIQQKLRSLYDDPQNCRPLNEDPQQLHSSTISYHSQSNLSKIQARIQEHSNLINKIKSKIQKNKKQQQEYKQTYINLLKTCTQKYGHKSIQTLTKLFDKPT